MKNEIPQSLMVEALLDGFDRIEEWNTDPFGHAYVDDFFPEQIADLLANELKGNNEAGWHEYANPLEIKRTSNDYNKFPPTIYQFFVAMSDYEVSELLTEITENPPLIPDVGLHGGGIHQIKNGGKLNTHMDYAVHPKLGMQRQLNAIIYLTPEWLPEYGGSLKLFDGTMDEPLGEKVNINCEFNRMVLFDTSPGSWHGFPDPIRCPDDVSRRSLAYYYCVAADHNTPQRFRARFAPSAEQAGDAEVAKLIEARSSLTEAASVYRTQ